LQHIDDSGGEVMLAILGLRSEPFFKLLEVAAHIDREAELRQRALDLLWQNVADEESSDGVAQRS